MPDSIEIIPSHLIDRSRWDACIRYSRNGLIYATSAYMDCMADNWYGIVAGDYDCVMPVPWRKKMGVRYCYHVPFVQQLGWFPLRSVEDPFLLVKKLFSVCRYGDYSFNYENALPLNNALPNHNYILRLYQTYDQLQENYRQDLSRNLKKASRAELHYSQEHADTAIGLYKELYHHRLTHFPATAFDNFRRFCAGLQMHDKVIVRKVTGPANELHAIALLIRDERRLYNIMNSTTDTGRKSEANHILFDCIFREFSESGLIFDFEGSDIPGIKAFYEKFGGLNQPYHTLHFNHLPWIIKWIKK